jgi:RimJ/RimL family protein N-acetyltransferase
MADPEVVLRPWQAGDATAIAPMTTDPHIKRWSSMGADVPAWIERQRAEPANAASLRLAERLGAQPRAPERLESDRTGAPARFIVFVAALHRPS